MMSLGLIFEYLYPVVPVIALIGYGPQLMAALKANDDMRNISLLTWFVWLGTWAIGLGYSSITMADFMLSLTAGINLVLHIFFIGIVLYKRSYYAPGVLLPARGEINAGVNLHIDEIAHQMHDQRDQRVKV